MTVMGRDKAEITGHASGRKREFAITAAEGGRREWPLLLSDEFLIGRDLFGHSTDQRSVASHGGEAKIFP